jgi:hypothetical protein
MAKRQKQQFETLAPESALQTAKRKLARWVIVTIDPVMLIIHLTIIYTLFLLADDFVLAQITRSFGDLTNQSVFAAAVLQGAKIFGAFSTAVGYVIHLTYSLYMQAKGVAKKIRENEEGSI